MSQNLPHQPYPRLPLLWGAEPGAEDVDSIIAPLPAPATPAVAGGRMGDRSAAIAPVTFAFVTTGVINTAFPAAVRVANQGFVTPVGIVSVDLATGILNISTDGIVGVFVARDTGPTLNVAQSTDVYAAHLCPALSSASFRSGQTFADDVAPKIGSGVKMALYVSSAGTNSGGNLISAVVTIRYFSITN
jgi:hypothetical protein